jgi:hypothetical protein
MPYKFITSRKRMMYKKIKIENPCIKLAIIIALRFFKMGKTMVDVKHIKIAIDAHTDGTQKA